jgi:hypothetical protein
VVMVQTAALSVYKARLEGKTEREGSLSPSLSSSSVGPHLSPISLLSILLLFFAVLGMEPRALHVLDKHSATELYPGPHPHL